MTENICRFRHIILRDETKIPTKAKYKKFTTIGKDKKRKWQIIMRECQINCVFLKTDIRDCIKSSKACKGWKAYLDRLPRI